MNTVAVFFKKRTRVRLQTAWFIPIHLFLFFRLREIMDQLDSGRSLSMKDMKQELGIAVAMLDKANVAAPAREYRFVSSVLKLST